MSVSIPLVDLDFTPTGSASQFIEFGASLTIQTDNRTSVTMCAASIDENMDLKHTDVIISKKLASISTSITSTAFSDNNWVYRVTTPAPPDFDFLPGPNFNFLVKKINPAK